VSTVDDVTDLRAPALPLAGVGPDLPDDDLAPLLERRTGARLVGLGEATHGDHESFAFKCRLIRALVRHHGFTLLIFERGVVEMDAYDRYITGELATVTIVVPLGRDDLGALRTLYRHYPEGVFRADHLEHGAFYDAYLDEQLIAAGGTHIVAELSPSATGWACWAGSLHTPPGEDGATELRSRPRSSWPFSREAALMPCSR
jgi:hypothetical protein